MQHLGVGEEQGEVVNHNLEAGVLYLVLGEGAEEAEVLVRHLGVEQGEVVDHSLEAGGFYLVVGEEAEEAEEEEAEEVKMMDILKKKKKCRKMIWIKELDFKLP